MKQEILKELQQLESEQRIRILLAVESGSRAWGLASTDSDWDVRFIYMHAPAWYLQIDRPKDSIERMLDNDLDLMGWELQKALRLFRKSNPTLLEWLHSPIVYLEREGFGDTLRGLEPKLFNPKACMYHYLNMARKIYEQYLERETVNLKKYFYCFRAVLSARYISQHHRMPPIRFEQLMGALELPTAMKERILKLLEQKGRVEESQLVPRDARLNQYLSEQRAQLEAYVGSIEVDRLEMTPVLNELFRKIWNTPFEDL